MRRALLPCVLSLVVVCAVVCYLVGCGGDGGTWGNVDRVLRGVVVEDDFVVAAGERVAAEGDVVVQCQTATVAGEILSRPSAGTGAKGGSITIEAQNAIVVTGKIQAGAGTNGAATGAGGNGGVGGGVTLYSASGDITLGGGVAPGQVRPRQTGSASLQSGNGGNGGNGTLGGAGGVGGNIVLECPNGTLHLSPATDMLVLGNGGNGGNGNVPAAQLGSVTIPETLPNAGGDTGTISGHVGAIDGLPISDGVDPERGAVKVVQFGEDMVSGWEGGNAGSSTFGDGPVGAAGRGVIRPAAEGGVGAIELEGARGGDGGFHGGNGAPVIYSALGAVGVEPGLKVTAVGGDGGTALADPTFLESAAVIFTVLFARNIYGGDGGDAWAVGGTGAQGGPGAKGGQGGDAEARGGHGGRALHVGIDEAYWHQGTGGYAEARGGVGGAGGDGTSETNGGGGGRGGSATATGGNGGFAIADATSGAGGRAIAVGGKGGDGGDGNWPGLKGGGGPATATGGRYNPVGAATQTPGAEGADGAPITEPPPATERKYGVVETQYSGYLVNILRQWFSWLGQLVPNSVRPAATLPVSIYVVPGESAYVNAARTRLWLGTDVYVHSVNDPLGAATDGPIFVIPGESSSRVCTVWVDETRDLLYALPWWSAAVYVYEHATTATTNKNPVRTIQLVNLGAPATGLTGDGTGDRLFVRTPTTVGVIDGASTRSGAVTPDRKLTNIATSTVGTGIAYARQQDMLYLGMTNAVGRISSASTATGNVTPTLIQGAATGITTDPVSLDAYGDTNVLFVAVNRGALVAFNNASTISGNAAFAKRDTSFARLIGAATFVEP